VCVKLHAWILLCLRVSVRASARACISSSIYVRVYVCVVAPAVLCKHKCNNTETMPQQSGTASENSPCSCIIDVHRALMMLLHAHVYVLMCVYIYM